MFAKHSPPLAFGSMGGIPVTGKCRAMSKMAEASKQKHEKQRTELANGTTCCEHQRCLMARSRHGGDQHDGVRVVCNEGALGGGDTNVRRMRYFAAVAHLLDHLLHLRHGLAWLDEVKGGLRPWVVLELVGRTQAQLFTTFEIPETKTDDPQQGSNEQHGLLHESPCVSAGKTLVLLVYQNPVEVDVLTFAELALAAPRDFANLLWRVEEPGVDVLAFS